MKKVPFNQECLNRILNAQIIQSKHLKWVAKISEAILNSIRKIKNNVNWFGQSFHSLSNVYLSAFSEWIKFVQWNIKLVQRLT